MRTPSFLVGCGIVLSALAIHAGDPASTAAALGRVPVTESAPHGFDCNGEPCDAVARGARAFFDRDSWTRRQRPLVRRLSHGHGTVPADAGQRRGEVPDSCRSVRRYNPKADDPLFRPIDADDFRINGEQASDYSNLRQNGLIRIVFALPPNIRLIDPATNAPSSEANGRRLAHGSRRDGCEAHGRGRTQSLAARPEPDRRLSARCDDFATLQEQALGALTNHAQIQHPPPQRLLDDLSSFQRVLFTNRPCARALRRDQAGATPLPDADPPLDELEQQGKVVFARACAQCHGGPGQSTPQARWFACTTSRRSARGRSTRVTPPRFDFAPCPPRLARNARTYEIT